MPILLFRVDERLIHGQVVIGWGGVLRPGRFLVVDGPLAESEWEQELYVLGLPEGATAEFSSPEAARPRMETWMSTGPPSVLLTRDIETMLEIAKGGVLTGRAVNLGGIHHRNGRTEVLPYLFLDDGDRELLRQLANEGVEVSAQDLPGSPKVSLTALLG